MKLFLQVLVSAALVVAAPVSRGGRILDRSIAIINDEIVLESDLKKFQFRLQSKNAQELFGGVDPKLLRDPGAVLELLIEEKLINQQVKKLDLQATDPEVDGQIRAIQNRNGISAAQLTERLKQLATTMAEYREGIKRQLERHNLVEREIKPSLDASEEQLRRFYLGLARGEDREVQYKIAHILIAAGGGQSGEQRAKRVWEEVSKAPNRFESFVKEYSDDSSQPQGLLGFFSASSLTKEFQEIVPNTPVGKITIPIRTSAGYHIVRVLETRTGDFANLSKEKKDALKHQMVAEEIEKRMASWLEKKKREAFIKRLYPPKGS